MNTLPNDRLAELVKTAVDLLPEGEVVDEIWATNRLRPRVSGDAPGNALPPGVGKVEVLVRTFRLERGRTIETPWTMMFGTDDGSPSLVPGDAVELG